MKRLHIHVVSETLFHMKGQGVHTAFVDCVDMLKSQPDIEVVINGEGWGDIMHAHTYGPYYFWKGRCYKGRRILTAHVIPDSARGSLPLWRFYMPLVRWYLRRVYSYATVCLAISPMVEDAIRCSGAKTRIVRAFNPIAQDKFAPTAERRAEGRKLLHLADDAFVVLGVGQLQGRKGVDDFFDIAQACPDLTFVWAGGRPFGVVTEGVVRLNRLMASPGKNLLFPGMFELDQMPLVYNAADAFLFPSHQENSPMAPIEAAAAGLPVVFRDLEEYAALYECNYLKARNTEEFIALTRRLASDAAFRKQAGDITRHLLLQFDRKKIRAQLLALYNEVYDSRMQ
jgi:1,2-diacylglycerol-3-alpha-glucose alpha-1,2-galactosyltransferase